MTYELSALTVPPVAFKLRPFPISLQKIDASGQNRRQSGDHLETGLEEINGDSLEADFWRSRLLARIESLFLGIAAG
jgi:hypothetical protein